MAIDKKYVNHFINVASKAALALSFFVGKKNKIAEK
jgi:fructose-1,6-bisphosphatase II / sedoheptulose-1,7-bisphosphatase